MWEEFKNFAFKGNVVDMAIGVIIGNAFGKIVTSVVSDLVMPFFASVTSGIKFTDLSFVIGDNVDSPIMYGNFIQNIVDFLIIAFSIFLAVKCVTKLRDMNKNKEEAEEVVEETKPSSEELLAEIRDLLKSKEE